MASLQEADTTKAGIAPDGRIAMYDGDTGAFLGNLTRPAGLPGQFNPRGIVFGPDGMLYVSVFDSANLATGHIVQYDPGADTSTIFATNDGDGIAEPGEALDLHRPEGLTFGPDGRLYVANFRAEATDTDKVVILHGVDGTQVGAVPLHVVGQPRAFGQALVFGPDDFLFVPTYKKKVHTPVRQCTISPILIILSGLSSTRLPGKPPARIPMRNFESGQELSAYQPRGISSNRRHLR